MVLVNTQPDVEFKYFLEVPKSRCTFCSGRDRTTGKTKLYLVFHEHQRVYTRNGLRGTWEELESGTSRQLRNILNEAYTDISIPRYSSNKYQSLIN